MRLLWVLTLGLVISTAIPGCKRRPPEPIPGPKAVAPAMAGHTHMHAAGIAWFQGSVDEAFARAPVEGTCYLRRAPMAPLAPDLPPPPRTPHSSLAAPTAPPTSPAAYPRRPLV
jgi:hypothetical protein